MIRIKINRGRHLIFSVPILLLFVFIFFYSCTTGPISKKDRDSIKSVRISINKIPKINTGFRPNIYIDFDKLDKKATDIFGLVQSYERVPDDTKKLCILGRSDKIIKSNNKDLHTIIKSNNKDYICSFKNKKVVAAFPAHGGGPFVFLIFSGLQSFQLLRFEGPYANDPTVKNYWDTNGVIKGRTYERMIEFMVQKQNIDTAETVREEFARELKRSGLFPSIVSEGGDAEINLTFSIFGFHHHFGFETICFGIIAKITNSDGAVLWKNNAYRTTFSKEIPKRPGVEYLNNRDLIIKDIKELAQILSLELIKKAGGGS
jgi:hypothetical protein